MVTAYLRPVKNGNPDEMVEVAPFQFVSRRALAFINRRA